MKLTLLKKRLAYVLLGCFFALNANAQNKTVSGKVTSEKDGSPISGASVIAKGTRKGTQTNSSGNFTLEVAPGVNKLVVTTVGFVSTEVTVNGANTDLALKTSEEGLAEVVVIGYGTVRKKDLTGAVTSIQAKDFNKGTYTSADQLIQGKVAGVQIINNSGTPGGATTVKIRGASALTGSGQPLYVVDGVPLDGRSARPGLGDFGAGGSNPGNNPLNFINPSDIASIDVLKDASATAIYGSRAAYGVVLITTKRGKTGDPKLDFNTSFGTSKIAKRVKVLDAGQFREALSYYGLGTGGDKGSNVDALDAILQTGNIQNYNLGMSGGTENAKYRVSLGVLNQEGIVRKTGIKKYTASISTNFKFLDNKKLGLDINIIPSQYSEQIAPITNDAGSRGSLIGNALQWNPTENLKGVKNGVDTFNVIQGDLINPLALQEAYSDKSKVTTILASISPYYKITKELEYRMLYSVNYSTGVRGTTLQPFINFTDVFGRGRVRIAQSQLQTEQITHTLNYNKQISTNLSVNGLLGFEYLKFKNKGFDAGGVGQRTQAGGFGSFGLNYEDYIQYSDPTTRQIGSYSDPKNELQSYFVRGGLNYEDKYLFTGTFRADGSTKFGDNNKYGYFPSLSGAWVVSKESFFHVPQINSLKIRGGWGKTGNQEFPSGSARKRYSFSGNGGGSTPANNSENANLKWQADRQYNVGLDMSLLKNRITFTMDYFNKRTTDLLYPTEPAVPAVAGVVRWKNLGGIIDNKGFEFAINSEVVSKKDYSIDLGVNATFVKNEVSGLNASINTGALNGQGITGSTVEVIKNGLPINAFFTRQFLGLGKDGFASYTDGGDVLYYVGNPNPKALLGISSTFRYKKLSLSANLNGAFGHKLYNNTLNSVINVGSISNGKNIALSVLRDPVKESFANPLTASSRYLERGDYLKMTNATLSYNFGSFGKSIKGLSLYVTGQNLFVITKYSGFDPEVNTDKNVNGVPSTGIEYIPYPTARTITFGINAGF